MKTFTQFFEENRKESEIDYDEVSQFVYAVQSFIVKRKANNIKAADIYHDVIRVGKFEDWVQDNVVPLWDKYGYPRIGTPGWKKVEDGIKKLIN